MNAVSIPCSEELEVLSPSCIEIVQRIAILDETVRKRIPHGSATRWNFKSRTINTVYEYREQLIECMGKIESTSKQAVAINQAGAIRRMLEDSKFVFWLTASHNIMPHVDVLYNQLQKTRTDAALIRKQKDRLKTELGVIYRRSDFRDMTGAISLLQFIIENNLQTTFSETYKLLLIVAIPMTTAEAERCCSTLK
ncbi:hypothetical protein AVEN_182989-1 [Araneus ventricosus]|uniref:HAT C-terminal dimerisation domain-containing protein n=1 Tax=Araneus ventricosus TaxID=182803 RepID=A0A4Y2RP96_ARAVE|nr:hypothetical protein AVEN_182989-1 [Araneus ventricosus]